MAIFEYTTVVHVDPATLFDFLVRPRNLLQVMPRSPKIEFVDAPDRLALGSRFTAKVSKYCFHSTSISEVTWFEEGVGFTDIQLQGPFQRWEHTHTVAAHRDGSMMLDRIDAQPPTGFLGWLVNERRLRKELALTFAYRQQRLNELFPPTDVSSQRN